jgi:hypothetical protein
MFVIITDGHENASTVYSADKIKRRIERQKQKGWEFIFFGANMDAITEANKLGIAADRAQNFHANSVGIHAAFESMSASSSAYRGK